MAPKSTVDEIKNISAPETNVSEQELCIEPTAIDEPWEKVECSLEKFTLRKLLRPHDAGNKWWDHHCKLPGVLHARQ